ncbi:MAG: tetratricopeptide repeat protein [Myxococcota bacterium]
MATIFSVADCTIDLDRAEVRREAGAVTPLTRHEVRLLAYLAERAGRVVPTLELQTRVLGYAATTNTAALTVAVRRLRQKIERDPGSPTSLVTVRGLGFRLELTAVEDGSAGRGRLFVGRGPELQALRAAADPVVCLVGPPGVGKTRLARAFAAAWTTGPVVAVSLRGCTDAAEVHAALGSALGVAPPSDDVRWAAHVSDGRPGSLWILDNAEGCTAPIGRLLGALATSRSVGSGSSRVVVTSRIAVPGATVWVVPPLAADPSTELFRALAQRARPELDPDAELPSGPDLGGVIAALGGLPLAIELAAARIGVLSLRELRQRLADPLRLLKAPGAGIDEPHRSLEAALTVSWELLSAAEQSAFAQLSAFRGGFSLVGAEAVVDVGQTAVIDLLQALCRASLVSARPEPSTALRFDLLPSLAAFAAARLASDPIARTACEVRHRRWVAAFAEPWIHDLPHGPRRLTVERENIVAAAQRSDPERDASEPHAAAVIALAASQVSKGRGPLTATLAVLQAALCVPTLDEADDARVRAHAGEVCRLLGRSADARAYLERALAAHRGAGRRAEEGILCGNLALVDNDEGHPAEARRGYESAIAIHREVGNRWAESVMLGNLANLDSAAGRRDQARAALTTALALHRDLGSRESEGSTLANLANLSHELGEPEEAYALYEAALAIHREVGSRRLEGVTSGNIGVLCAQQGRSAEALRWFDAALAAHREVGNRRSEAVALANIGDLQREAGQLDPAVRSYEAALAVHRESGDRRMEGRVRASLGAVARSRGLLGDARGHYQAALDLAEAVEDLTSEAETLVGLAGVALDDGRPAEARALLTRATERLGASGSVIALADAMVTMADLELRDGRRAEAGACIARARDLARRMGTASGSTLDRAIAERQAALDARA